MRPNQSLNQLSANILTKIDKVLEQEKPELVLIHGDTTSAAMVSLAAFHRGIRVAHIEAGLRTYNKTAPFPEEVNRQITARFADFHFAPSLRANSNLVKEEIPKDQICITGNTVVDSIQWAIEKMELTAPSKEIKIIKGWHHPDSKLILVTGHRRENFGEGFIHLCEALLELSKKEEVEIIYPVHLNPKVKGPVQQLLGDKKNIHLIAPVSYPTMLWLIKECTLIISDSGGIQEEAPTFKKPVLVTRDVSERMEGLDAGFSFLVGTNKDRIVNESLRLLEHPPDFYGIDNPYGDGRAAERIVSFLKKHL
jgi:UDP-N-acetylglucosamine 2-epimerase (non-hydrolysing)